MINPSPPPPENTDDRRDGSQAVRVVAAMCHEDVLGAMTRDRNDQDQSYSTTKAVMEKALEIFKRDDLVIRRPPEMDDHDPDGYINPMNFDYKAEKYNLKWFTETWQKYTRPKFKKILDKWWKGMGNGDISLANFANYTDVAGTPYRWMLWVYYIDLEVGLLLLEM